MATTVQRGAGRYSVVSTLERRTEKCAKGGTVLRIDANEHHFRAPSPLQIVMNYIDQLNGMRAARNSTIGMDEISFDAGKGGGGGQQSAVPIGGSLDPPIGHGVLCPPRAGAGREEKGYEGVEHTAHHAGPLPGTLRPV